MGTTCPTRAARRRFPVGSIAVKAAWRPLTAADPPAARARHYVERAEIVDVAKTLAAGHAVCSESDVALVGLHIAIKTRSRPQWIWSTFEHVDNVPPAGDGDAREPDARDAGVPYAYFDPSRPKNLWPPFGTAEALPVDWTNPPKLDPKPMQVVRRHPIDPSIMAVNRAYWNAPASRERCGSITCWSPSNGRRAATRRGRTTTARLFPGRTAPRTQDDSYKSTAEPEENLINTTMETYLQDQPSSCMACHQAVSNARGDDFVGTLAGVR